MLQMLVLDQRLDQMLCLPLGLDRMLLHLLVCRRRHLLVLVRQMRHLHLLLVQNRLLLLGQNRQINYLLVRQNLHQDPLVLLQAQMDLQRMHH